VIVRLQSPGQRHGTDYQQQSGHLTSAEFQEPVEILLLLMDHFFFFSIHALYLNPMYGP